MKWPKEHWTLLLQSIVIGKAREIYTQYSLEQSSNYDTVKELILKVYELVSEAYRQKFRNCRKRKWPNSLECARTKENYLIGGALHRKLSLIMRNLSSSCSWKNSKVHKFWHQIFLRREASWSFGSSISFGRWLCFDKPVPRKPFPPQSGPKSNPSNQSGNSSHIFNPKPKPSGENKGQNPLSPPICNYCKQSGRIISECLTLKRKREKRDDPKPKGLISLRSKPQSCVKDQIPIQAKTSETDSVMEIYEPFLSDDFVSLNSDYAQSTPMKIVRDTGASQFLILADTLPISEKTLLGQVSLFRV